MMVSSEIEPGVQMHDWELERLGRRCRRRRLLQLAGVGASLVSAGPLLGACAARRRGGGEATVTGHPAAIILLNQQLGFEPANLTVARGTVVIWRNSSPIPHTVTADPVKLRDGGQITLPAGDTPWDSGPIAPGQSWSRSFDRPGICTYFCIPHQSSRMLGTVTIE
jgi:plastocyanin